MSKPSTQQRLSLKFEPDTSAGKFTARHVRESEEMIDLSLPADFRLNPYLLPFAAVPPIRRVRVLVLRLTPPQPRGPGPLPHPS